MNSNAMNPNRFNLSGTEKLAAYGQTAKHGCRSTIRIIYSRTPVTQTLKEKRKTVRVREGSSYQD